MNYSLSIRQCTDGFSFFVHSIGSGQLLTFDHCRQTQGETIPETLQRLLTNQKLRGFDYERVCLFSSSVTTRLPLDEFRKEDIVALYRLAFAGENVKPEEVRYQILPTLELVELYSMPAGVEEVLRNVFPQASIQNVYASMMAYAAKKSQGSSFVVTFHAFVEENRLFIVALKQGRLLYANIFAATTDEDRQYFILYVWRLLGMEVLHDACNMYGASDNLVEAVRRFVVNVRNIDAPQLVEL